MRTKNLVAAFSLVVFGVIFGAVLVSSFGWVRPGLADVRIGSDAAPVQDIDPELLTFNNAFIEVAEKVTPSIVQIRVISRVEREENKRDPFHFFMPFREDIPRERQGSGSGVIISEDGYILTNNHVVENASQVTVDMNDRTSYDAEVIGTDPLTDLAVIKIDASDLPAAYLGDSDNLKVGQWVMAIGNPLAFTSTVTAGIVSAFGRSLNLIRDSYGVENYIQTDAVINRGNSGGALVDLSGAVIGINSAIATDGITSSYIGYGFAIPINLAKAVAEDLIVNGTVNRGYIGVRIEAVNSATAKAIGFDKPKGVLIQEVMKDGSAAQEDVKAGDVILKVDDVEVNQPNELQAHIAKKRANDNVILTLYRDGETITRTIKLKAREDNQTATASNSSSKKDRDLDKKIDEIEIENIGLKIKDLKSDQLEKFDTEYGVLITEVKRFGKAYDQGLAQGLVITEVDRKPVESVVDFDDAVKSKAGSAVLLKVIDSQGGTRFVGLEIPN
ncbi:MAG: trypsin-like peptidase domain-containing protein [Melioribacteraceae bacterium]|nr:trypsin-like peptidase domain-containing protein [Melioribacteraceae bacterium]